LAERRDDWFFEPFKELDTMFDDLDKTFGRFFGGPLRRRRKTLMPEFSMPDFRMPALDVQDKGDHYLVEAEMPGIDKEDIDVELRDDKLTIKGETKKETKEEKEDYVRRERGYKSFYREIPVTEEMIADEANASFKNGVLSINLPKKEKEEKEGRKLEVK
ncbi:MAG: Hsp20/alpha crystallin family protein, partial [Thermoplasmatota archaeon]